MTSIKVKFRPSTVQDNEGSIFFSIIHNRKVRQLGTRYHVKPDEWNASHSMVIVRQNSERKVYVLTVRQRIRRDVERLTKIVRKLDEDGVIYSVDDVAEEFRRYRHDYSLANYMNGLIDKFRLNGRIRTSETYTSALSSFMTFLSETKNDGSVNTDDDFLLDNITSEIMEEYQAWHIKRGNTYNTVSFYIRILRAVYNRAVEENIIVDMHPFRHVYTGVEKTIKRALPIQTIRKIKKLDLSERPALDYARDMFILSFYLRGMSFIDMAFLLKSDLQDGHIVYRRHKTGQQLIIEWTKEMQEILDKYPANPTHYLLPIINRDEIGERNTYRNVSYNINHNLKKIALMVGVAVPFTMYAARHSWASAAKAKGIPVSVISEGMGHDSEKTTRIYLSSFDMSVVDRANSLILSSL